MNRLSRLNDHSNSSSTTSTNNAAYGDRVPSQNSLYDWSPAMDLDTDADVDVEHELEQILAELRREQPNTHPEILRVLGRSQLDSDRDRIRSISTRLNQERSASTAGESLRSTAILQSVRRHPRFSARNRDYLQRYNHDRERESSQSSESQTRYLSESARHLAMQRLSDTRTSLDRERRDLASRADSWRRSFHRSYHSPPPVAAPVSPILESTVRYLSQIRHANGLTDSLHHFLDAGFVEKDHNSINWADFVTDTSNIPPPVKTSWLAPGAVLSGCQHATSVQHASSLASVTGGDPILTSLAPPARPWLANSYSTTRNRSRAAPDAAPVQSIPQDRWPVKVTIHEVDWENMSLSATMEAYNVPSHPRSHQPLRGLSDGTTEQYTRTSSITTFLEGEILDFNQHTLLTESFKSTALNDATYWRKLPPFQHLSDDEFVRSITSKKWLSQVLHKDWILMRWKERCFVKSLANSTRTSSPLPANSSSEVQNPYLPSDQYTPYRLVRDPETNQLQVEIAMSDGDASSQQQHASFDDSGCGLTISGFYYICLRRSDGRLEGLYYDPQSSPYQCLELESRVGGTVGAWAFR